MNVVTVFVLEIYVDNVDLEYILRYIQACNKHMFIQKDIKKQSTTWVSEALNSLFRLVHIYQHPTGAN